MTARVASDRSFQASTTVAKSGDCSTKSAKLRAKFFEASSQAVTGATLSESVGRFPKP